MKGKIELSIVSPVYCAEKTLEQLVQRIKKSLQPITKDYEIILVDDGSPDDSWKEIQRLSVLHPEIRGFKLSRNFGQHYAITAGLDQAKGEWAVVMDCDLQDQPEEIPKLYAKAQEGYDAVLARRVERKDSFFKRLSSKLFFLILAYLTGTKLDPHVANFGIYNRKIIDGFCGMKESIRVFPVMVNWMGFNVAKINVIHAFREQGKSSYTLKKLFNLALDIILAFSDKPIRLVVKLGALLSFFSLLFAGLTLIRYFIGEITVSGYTSLIISISFFSGIIIMILGVIGLYIGKIFEGVKARPLYIIQSST